MTREEAKEILTHNWTRVDNPNYSESELDEAFFMAIEALQTDLVRCKDCKRFIHYADGCGVCTERDNILTYQNQNDFCSYGERKGGDEK